MDQSMWNPPKQEVLFLLSILYITYIVQHISWCFSAINSSTVAQVKWIVFVFMNVMLAFRPRRELWLAMIISQTMYCLVYIS